MHLGVFSDGGPSIQPIQVVIPSRGVCRSLKQDRTRHRLDPLAVGGVGVEGFYVLHLEMSCIARCRSQCMIDRSIDVSKAITRKCAWWLHVLVWVTVIV